jgi:hypothetical protein
MTRFFLAVCALGFLLTFTGCGDSLVKVSGKVTLDGNPLTTGNISFAPMQSGQVAIGTIDEKGNYTLQSGTQKGVPAGTYRVTIVAVELVPPSPQNPEPLPKVLTPPRYNDATTSGLTADVKPGNTTHNFDLKTMP